ncbi:MAG: permease [Myxococcales bacterium]|nr:permease [Myxococcales bacterium]
MKVSLIALGVTVLALIGVAAWQGNGAVGAGFKSAATNGLRFAPVLLVAFIIMGFVDVLLPRQIVETWLSDAAGWRGQAVAWLAGVLTPAGSIIGLPLVAALYKAGVGPGVLVTYLTSMATLSFIRVPLEIGFYGWRLTALRIVVSVILPFVAGFLARVTGPFILPGS